ncbi:hypothetical protein [Mucilaginibacter sp.]|uniref:hypothetical protein n=1 Tax=Mucilaginibacter sp. TaxID=1882438 RepID=UPI0035BC1ADC
MKKLILIALLFFCTARVFADSRSLDSLKTLLQVTTNDSLKAGIYKQIAAEYLQYDTIKHVGVKRFYQSQALNYTMLALHNYSYYLDTLGVRTCFDYLSKVYLSQEKYSQAKWFLLQSNKISRDRKDIPGIITSLIKLSTVKMSNEEYELAMRDLNEAQQLSTVNKLPHFEVLVQQNFAYLYNRMGEEEKGSLALDKANKLSGLLKSDEKAMALALQKAPDFVVLNKKSTKPRKPLKTTVKKRAKLKTTKP